jgi:hypothetical protein
METIANISFMISILSFFTATQIKLYTWAYSRGHDHGKHIGFSEGLWKAYERSEQRKAIKV